MKVLLIDPWGVKNTSNYLNGLAFGLSKNVELTLMTNFFFKKTTEANYVVKRVFFKKSENAKNTIFRKIIRGIEYFFGYKKIIKELRATKYDVVHINWLLNYKQDIYFLKKIKKQFNLKIVYTAHNVLPHINGYKKLKELDTIYDIVDTIIVHGNYIREEFSKLFPTSADKVYIQKLGCNLSGDTSFDSSKINSNLITKISLFERVYIFLGLIFENKGVDRIIDYWLLNNPNALLIVAGKKSSKYELFENQKLIAEKQKNILILDDYIDDNLMNFLISKSDLILLPYRHASMSGVVFTAADFCKPVLATSTGSICEYLEDKVDSFVVENNDKSLFEGISSSLMVDKTDLDRMGKKLRDNISTKCDWNSIGLDIFEKVYS